MEKKKNEELQSRRDFFKKAAKGAFLFWEWLLSVLHLCRAAKTTMNMTAMMIMIMTTLAAVVPAVVVPVAVALVAILVQDVQMDALIVVERLARQVAMALVTTIVPAVVLEVVRPAVGLTRHAESVRVLVWEVA